MAEAIISEIVSKPVEELASMAFKKINFAVSKDLDSTIEQLGFFFRFINDILQKVDPFEASNNIEQMKIERLQLMHDELNCFFTKLAARTGVQREVMGSPGFTSKVCSFLSSPQQLLLRFKYAHKVNDLTTKLKNLASVNELCENLVIDSSSGNHDLRTAIEDTSPLPVTDVFIGRETDQENIIDLLRNNSVVAIVGVGGQGKTTLAQHVCQDHRVKGSFDKLLWVSLTPKSTVDEIFQKIVIYATGKKPGLEHLHLQVLQAIDGKKCLLVLDNLYFSKNLRVDTATLNAILQRGGFWRNGGKVLITARSKVVVKLRDAPKQYELPDLAEDNCWILLHHYAIKHEEEKECGVEEIGKEIARMCPKMPLVLKTIGCYLADKDYKSQWEHFKNKLALDPTLYMSGQQKIKQILKLCYDQLDHNLKRCAAYCSLYPKGHLYNTNDMVGYWIALGFVEPRDGMSLEDVGDEYVLELRQRAFFEEAGSFKVFKMHDVMHDLMRLIGKEKHQMIDSKTKDIDEGVRHVSLNMHDLNWDVLLRSISRKQTLQSISHKQTLQSILLVWAPWVNGVHGEPLRSRIDKLIPACQKLKVLQICNQEIVTVPSSISELTLVRHLDLSRNLFCKLPNEITKMVNLLTLDLSFCHNLQELPSKMGKLVNLLSLNLDCCSKLKELPRDIGKLVKLRHLRVLGCNLRCMPEGFGNLTELETLDIFVVGENIRSSRGLSKAKAGAKLEELGHLKNLKGRLFINVAGQSKNIVSEAGNAYLEMEAKLRQLTIKFQKKGEEDEKFLEGIQLCGETLESLHIKQYGGKRLPSWMTDDGFHKRFPKLHSFELRRTNEIIVYIIHSDLSAADYDEDEFMRFTVEGNEDELEEWVPRYSKIKEHLKMGSTELSFTTRRRDGPRLTDLRDDVTLENVCFRIHQELAPRSSCGGQRQSDSVFKSCFPNLTELWLWNIPELEVLPEEFRDLSSLKELRILGCPKLKAIPDWIDTLSSLELLDIGEAPQLMGLPTYSIGSLLDRTGLEVLPHQISNLPESCKLYISECSKELFDKCAKSTGEYWPYLQLLNHVSITSSEGDSFKFERPRNNGSSEGNEISMVPSMM